MSTFVEKILGKPAGEIATICPDYVVINDGVSHAAVNEIKSVKMPEQVWVIYDHDVPTGRPEAAEILKKNLNFANTYHCRYVQAQGVGYQYLLNHVVKAGEVVIGGGSHGAIYGARGALGLNVSIPELARVVETGRYSVVVPETIFISVNGILEEGVHIMDAALAFLHSVSGIAGKAVEFYCPALSFHERSVLCSMATMTGAFTASVTEQIPEISEVFHLGQVKPMIMLPCKTRQDQKTASVCERSEYDDVVFQAGQIGGYTGGTIEELRKAAALIKEKQLAPGFRLSVCPATSEDYLMALEEGILTAFIDYGAQINAAGDHSTVIQGAGAMGPGEKLITTGLYTYEGAMGCEDAEVYTASVETVIKASCTSTV